MVQTHHISDREQAIDTMIALTRPSPLHRIIAGGDGIELSVALRQRGFMRIATTKTCSMARRQHAFGLLAGRASEVESGLEEIEPFLGASAAVAVLIESHDGGICMKIRNKLERSGFRIDAGVRCQQGLVLSASRQQLVQLKSAA
jgi:hypothetical protein